MACIYIYIYELRYTVGTGLEMLWWRGLGIRAGLWVRYGWVWLGVTQGCQSPNSCQDYVPLAKNGRRDLDRISEITIRLFVDDQP